MRVVSYNIEADINGVTAPRSGLYQVLEGIGEEKVQGNVRPIDILGLEETTSNSTTVAPIVSALNSYYNGSAVYAQSPYQASENGGDTFDGNGPNALVYNTSTLNLLASVGVGTPEGSSNGEYRQVVRYEFQPVGDTGSTGIFYVYASHMKSLSSGSDQTDEGYQLDEAKIILQDQATLPANSSVLYTGDLNSDNSDTAIPYMESSVAGEAYDPLAGAYSSKIDESDSSTSLNYRDDYELMTAPVYQDTGTLAYVSGSYHSLRSMPHVMLLCVGGGDDRQKLQAQAERLAIADHVIFTGAMPHRAALRHLRLMDVVAVPSRLEGFGLSAAEAMAMRRPVIASAAGALPEVVGNDGVAGELVPPENPDLLAEGIKRLLGSPSLRAGLGAAARKRVEERFSFAAFTRRHLDLYESVCSHKSSCLPSGCCTERMA